MATARHRDRRRIRTGGRAGWVLTFCSFYVLFRSVNAFAPDTSPNGTAQEPPPLDKPAGEAAPPPKESILGERKSPLDGIEDGMRADQLESLGWLRRHGMAIADRLDRYSQGLLLFREQEAFKDVDVALAFSRVAKAVRQIIVLEQETAGLREMRVPRALAERAESREPEYGAPASRIDRDDVRDDLSDRDDIDDYDHTSPIEEIIAEVRADLDALPGAALAAQQMSRTAEPELAPDAITPFDPGERLPDESAEAYHQRLLAARIQALEARYGSTGPP